MADNDTLILVDKNDKEIGYEQKESCHRYPAKLHRAFSIFLFNSKNEMLVHKRHSSKKTWPGFWTNACCSHPRKGEKMENAVQRRLKEELGIQCPLTYLFKFVYEAKFDENWGEHELDYVFIGRYDGEFGPDKKEIEELKFVSLKDLKEDVQKNPKQYTPWFKIALGKVLEHMPKVQDTI